MVSRVERSTLANWWWTVDRWLLAALGTLVIFGLVLTMAASPPVAERLGLPTFHFVNKQVMFLVPSLAVFFAASLLSPAACAPRRAHPFHCFDGVDLCRASLRRGGEGRAGAGFSASSRRNS